MYGGREDFGRKKKSGVLSFNELTRRISIQQPQPQYVHGAGGGMREQHQELNNGFGDIIRYKRWKNMRQEEKMPSANGNKTRRKRRGENGTVKQKNGEWVNRGGRRGSSRQWRSRGVFGYRARLASRMTSRGIQPVLHVGRDT